MDALEKLGYKKVRSGFSDTPRYEKKEKTSMSIITTVIIINEDNWDIYKVYDEDVLPYFDGDYLKVVAAIEEVQRMRWGSFPEETRKKVHEKFEGRCAYCGREITLEEMQVDYVTPIRQGGTDDFKNLFPSCRWCNHYKRSMDLEGFRTYLETLHERLSKKYIVKVGINFGIVDIKPFDGTFYFEYYNKTKRRTR